MQDILIMLSALIAVAAFAGVLAGLFGVGGGIVLVPAFTFVFAAMGYDHAQLFQIAIATSLATIIFTSLRSVASHHKKNAVDWDILKAWALPIAIGAILAVLFLRGVRPTFLMFVFGVLAFLIAIVMFFGMGKVKIADEMPSGPKAWVMGAVTGFLSTMMGIGGGSIAVPLMVMHRREMHRAVATAAGFGGLIALPSVALFLLSPIAQENLPPMTVGYVNIPAFLIVISVTFITAPIGARLAHGLDAKKLKRFFAIFIVIVAINMIRKALG